MNALSRKLVSRLEGRFGKPSRGVAAVEYPLIVFLISLVMAPVLIVLGPGIGATFQKISDGIGHPGPNTGGDPTTDPTIGGPGSGPTPAVPCEWDNNNGYFNNRYWAKGTDYYPIDGWGLMGTLVHGHAGDVWVGQEGYTTLTVAQAVAQGTADTGYNADYWFWSKTNIIGGDVMAEPPSLDWQVLNCSFGNDIPPYNPTGQGPLAYRAAPAGGYCDYVTNAPVQTVAYLEKDFNNGAEFTGPNGSVYYSWNDDSVTPWADQETAVSDMYWVVDRATSYDSRYPTSWLAPLDDGVASYPNGTIGECTTTGYPPLCMRSQIGYYQIPIYTSVRYDGNIFHQRGAPVGYVSEGFKFGADGSALGANAWWLREPWILDGEPHNATDPFFVPDDYFWVLTGYRWEAQVASYTDQVTGDPYLYPGMYGFNPVRLFTKADVAASGVTNIDNQYWTSDCDARIARA